MTAFAAHQSAHRRFRDMDKEVNGMLIFFYLPSAGDNRTSDTETSCRSTRSGLQFSLIFMEGKGRGCIVEAKSDWEIGGEGQRVMKDWGEAPSVCGCNTSKVLYCSFDSQTYISISDSLERLAAEAK